MQRPLELAVPALTVQRAVGLRLLSHSTEKTDAKPDDAILFDLLADWAPEEAVRHRILVDNPAALYRFGRAG